MLITWSVWLADMKQHRKNEGYFFHAPIERIGVKEWLPVKEHSRTVYVKLRSEDVNLYDLEQNDMLLVQLVGVKKAPRDLDAKEA
jgi:hypothetical protein